MINALALRQGGQSYSVNVDGIRLSTQWGDLVPVELTSFTAIADKNNVVLNWSTATEVNNAGFEVQKIKGNNEFVTIGYVPGHGSTTEPQNYNFTDANLASGSYTYRLKQIDYNGTFSYSNEVNVDVTAPVQFELAQNYPNPFNPSTKINFSLAVDSKVSLKIFNVLGQEVAAGINSNLTAGSHQFNFDASSLNSGVYMYRIEANGIDGSSFVSTKKMVFTK
ncbi:MAG: T9SS type A sorting domain-containing protein [Ignavibacteriaceae bacterium]